MKFYKIKSHAKLNLALNVIGKSDTLHKIESITTFIELHDVIMIKKIKANKHYISFSGKYSRGIKKNNTVSKLLQILDKKKILNGKKFYIKIKKLIPNKAGLGGGSMNAACILSYLVKKKIISISKKEINNIAKLIGSDVNLGINFTNSVLTSDNKIKYFENNKKFHTLVVKPSFGCSTKKIYSKVRKFSKSKFKSPNIKMFGLDYLKKMNNCLEQVVLAEHSELRVLKNYLENLPDTVFARMTGSGSAFVAYFKSKEKCQKAKKQFVKKYKNYWCIASKTI